MSVTRLRMPVAVGADGLEVLGRDAPPALLRLHRDGSSPDAVRAGERVAVEVRGLGYLRGEDTAPDNDVAVRLVDAPVREWVVTGVPQGSAVPLGKPVGLFDLRQGAHLVVADGLLTWTTHLPGHPVMALPDTWRAPEGDPGDAFLSGEVQVSVVPGPAGEDAEERLTLSRLDPPVPRLVRIAVDEPLGVRAPRLARWWVRGPLFPAGSGRGRLSLDPLVALAWASDDGGPVRATPDEPTWPEEALTWHVVFRSGLDGDHCGAVLLPLPAADGEPGSATTCHVVGGRRGVGSAVRRTGLDGAVPPSIVKNPRTGRRALRVSAAWLAPAPGASLEVKVRVHRRQS